MIAAITDDWSNAKSLCLLCCLGEAARSSSCGNSSASRQGKGPFRKGIITQDVLLPIPPGAGSSLHCSLPPYTGYQAGKKSLFETRVFETRPLTGRVTTHP